LTHQEFWNELYVLADRSTQIPDPLFIPGAIVFHYIKVG